MKMSTNQSRVDEPSAAALQIFERLKVTVTPQKLLTLREDIDTHLLHLQKLARKDEMTPIDLAQAIAGGLHALLQSLATFSSTHQADVLGAALYFVSTDDEIADTAGILGLDDDAAIFNYVALRVGRHDLVVEP